MGEERIILIGGAPTAGKSTIAEKLSKHFGMPWIGTDQIREVMKGTVTEEERPMLFNSRQFTAEEFLNKFSPREIVQNEIDESEVVWQGVKAFIENEYSWHSFIVEGVALLPHLVAKYKDSPKFKAIFLVDRDADRIRDVVFNRGLWSSAKNYPDSVKEKEVEWVIEFNEYIIKEAEKFGFPTVEVTKGDQDMKAILSLLS
jgi:2-phosphoglycerate kinase